MTPQDQSATGPSVAPFAILAPRLFDGERMLTNAVVLVHDGHVTAALTEAEFAHANHSANIPLHRLPEGVLLAPGFIDVQVNGGGGVMFNDEPNVQGVASILAAHRAHGTTGLLPTLITDSRDVMETALANGPAITGMPGVLGLHFEGPFINPARKGAHRADYIVPADDAARDMLLGLKGLGRSLVTVAPELMPPGFIAALARAGIRVSAGHSEATAADMQRAAGEGLTGVTHLFNAMSQMQGRAPGLVGSALAQDGLFAGIIADGLHVDPVCLRAAFTAMGPERLMLVTDAMSSVGASSVGAATDHFMLMGREVRLHDGRLTTADGTLAGAHITMIECVRNAMAMMGATLEQALAMASRTPAAFLGLDRELGRVATGFRADLVALGPGLDVLGTWVGGNPA